MHKDEVKMSSKRLESILKTIPSATAKGELNHISSNKLQTEPDFDKLDYTRIVATIPAVLKDEIRSYIKKNKGDTETTIVLRALKSIGFNVPADWIVDKRTKR